MEKEKKFEVGDSVTYLSHAEAGALNTRADSRQIYHYGGRDFGGTVGIIRDYLEYNEGAKCWKILVSTHDNSLYSMLESEFKEYLNTSSLGQYQIY
jgi:hypothetical protein